MHTTIWKIPIGKFNFNLTNTITYTFKKIENNNAYFDITQIYAINSKNTDLSLKANGSGNGQIIYDIENTSTLSDISNIIQQQLLNKTSSQVNLLDHKTEP